MVDDIGAAILIGLIVSVIFLTVWALGQMVENWTNCQVAKSQEKEIKRLEKKNNRLEEKNKELQFKNMILMQIRRQEEIKIIDIGGTYEN